MFGGLIAPAGWWILVMLCMTVAPRAARSALVSDQPNRAPPLADIYLPTPSYTSTTMGFFSTGVVFADLNRDGFRDLILANGNDMSPQPLVVYHNQRGQVPLFLPRPNWISLTNEYFGGLCVGDINRDGYLDVAAAVGFDHQRSTAAGGIVLFRGSAWGLQPTVSYRSGGGYVALACALGDVDGDGDLDLAAAAISEGAGHSPPQAGEVLKPGRARIYLNNDGTLSTSPDWISASWMGAADVLLSDINQDGKMDLALAGHHSAVFYGRESKWMRVPFASTADWTSQDRHAFSFGMDAAHLNVPATDGPIRVPTGKGLNLAVSSGCTTSCESSFVLYQPAQSNRAVWRSEPAKLASKVIFAELNGDGQNDLLASQWGVSNEGAPLWIFAGRRAGFAPKPDFVTTQRRVGQALDVADLRQVGQQTVTRRFVATKHVTVLTLPERRVEDVLTVTIDDRPLAAPEYAWAVNANAVSLRDGLATGQSAAVTYKVSKVQDIALAVWNPQFGSDIYLSFLSSK